MLFHVSADADLVEPADLRPLRRHAETDRAEAANARRAPAPRTAAAQPTRPRARAARHARRVRRARRAAAHRQADPRRISTDAPARDHPPGFYGVGRAPSSPCRPCDPATNCARFDFSGRRALARPRCTAGAPIDLRPSARWRSLPRLYRRQADRAGRCRATLAAASRRRDGALCAARSSRARLPRAPGREDAPPQPSQRDREAALTTRLAYVVSGDADVDDVSRLGLEALSRALSHAHLLRARRAGRRRSGAATNSLSIPCSIGRSSRPRRSPRRRTVAKVARLYEAGRHDRLRHARRAHSARPADRRRPKRNGCAI